MVIKITLDIPNNPLWFNQSLQSWISIMIHDPKVPHDLQVDQILKKVQTGLKDSQSRKNL